ncbi:MAG: GNAT family N-acetyltransferase [Gammaproteobacteria bacterium]|nr:GNAT family N-acetyltransferase [Gammaproteobacteria bacterium]
MADRRLTTEVIEFRDELAGRFAALNYQWIERYFRVEAEDVKSLEDPRGIIDGGGQIFFVLVDGDVAGTAAMLLHTPNVFELAKMAVKPEFQGRGLSRLLMEACVEFGRDRGASEIMLLTNDRLAPAVGLYESAGFVATEHYTDARYARGNLEMRLKL